MENKKSKGFYATLTGQKKVVKYLTPYYYQGGKWYPVSKLGGQNVRKRNNSTKTA